MINPVHHGKTNPILGLLLTLLSGLAGAEKITSVTTAHLGSLSFHPVISAPATVVSLNQSRISAETPGRILAIKSRVGDSIAEDETLAEFDCRSNRIQLKQAQAALQASEARVTLAARQLKRSRSLRKGQSISEEILNQRQADVATTRADRQAQQARVEEATLNVDRCTLKAPFDAIVLERLASEGEWITPGQPVIRLLDSRQLEVSAQVPRNLTATLSNTPSIRFQDNSDEYPLQLRQVLPVVEPLSRNQEVRLLFPDRSALPGSSGRIIWQTPQPHLPADLPVRRGDRIGIFEMRDDRAAFIPLDGALEGQPAPVNLSPNTAVIIEGRLGLSDGDTVRIDNSGRQ